MKAEELRLGNLIRVSTNRSPQTVWGINFFDKDIAWWGDNGMHRGGSGYSKNCSFEKIKPIRLTEDWLKKFGFKKEFNKSYEEYFYNKNVPASKNCYYSVTLKDKENDMDGSFSIRRSDTDHFCLCYKLEFVHQLQNLFFVLTGEELTFKTT